MERAEALDAAAVRLAVRVGVCVDDESPTDALKAVMAHTGADMAQLDTWNGTRAASLSVQDCPRDVARVLAEELPADPVFGRRLRAAPSACLSEDDGFHRSPYYTDCFGPAGAASGLSLPLREASGQVTGFLHLASGHPGHFGERHRVLLDTLMPLLTRAAMLPHPTTALIPKSYDVSLIRYGHVEPVRGRTPAVVTADPEVCELIRRFTRQPTPYLQFLWPVEGRWFEVRMVRDAEQEETLAVACRPAPLPYRLTPRELEALTALAAGATNRQIAGTLTISERTAMTHVEHILAKLAAPGRTAAAVRAVREGIVLPSTDPASPRAIERLLGATPGRSGSGPCVSRRF
ncbi:LuxR C-terminal-related transcriptional regulator [Streptomyces sp. NPDC048282]|uniref:LuxR C-terminal-related transcriptional regulator n=1 Tax=Streptomyces sp. NPDC048282 TaxID=3365528 RepID=UPI00371260DF